MSNRNFLCVVFAVLVLVGGCGSDTGAPESPGVLDVEQAAPADTVPEGLAADAWSKITAQIDADRYKFVPGAGVDAATDGLVIDAVAPNPANRFRGTFSTGRLKVTPFPEVDEAPAWQVGVALESVGRVGQPAAVEVPVPTLTEGRMEYRRGNVTEWYINDARGIEQGFDIAERPDGEGELVVEVGFSGDLMPRLVDDETVHLKSSSGESVLSYSGLVAWDANGTLLDARMELRGEDRVSLVVDDARAVYPVTVDPWIESKKLLASDGTAGDQFGYSVSMSADVVVVGAYLDEDNGFQSGSAYVFGRNQGGIDNFGQVKKLVASDGAQGDQFGQSVSVSGDLVVVGALGDDDNGSNSGSAYVFARNEGGDDNFGQVKKLVASDGAADDYFGYSVSASEDVVVVGAYGHENGTDSGAAYVFARNQGGVNNFGEVKKLASDGADDFGISVSVSGDVVVVGAWRDDENGTGAAYVFARNQGGADNFGEVEKLVASDGADDFGISVSVSGDVVVVGAYGDDDNGTNSGSAYVFERNEDNADNFAEVKKLVASDGAAFDHFGVSVSVSADMVVVGAWADSDSGMHSGAVYVFARNEGGDDNFGQVKKLVASDGAAGDQFGWSVSVSEDVVIMGAHRDGTDTGSAYIFEVPNTPPVATDDAAGVDEDGSVTVDVLANDMDADGDALTVDSVTQPANGSVTNNGTDVTYTPDADFNGSDSFTYTVSDGKRGTDTATVSITVNPVNDAPFFTSTPVTAATQDQAYSYAISASDVDGDALTISAATLPNWLAFTDNGDGSASLTGTPTDDDVSTHFVMLEVTDGSLTDTQSFEITVANDGSVSDDTGDDVSDDSDDGSVSDDTDDGSVPDDTDEEEPILASLDDGCGCSSSSAGSNGLSAVLVLLGLLALRVRRSDFQ